MELIDKSVVVAEIKRISCENPMDNSWYVDTEELLNFINTLEVKLEVQEEPVSEDLENYINNLSKQFPDVSFAKLSRIAVRVAKWQEKQDQSTIELAEDHAMLAGMNKMEEQIMKNLWKPADGDDLPEIDREVIALLDNGKVVFAHRPPEYWDGKNIITGKVTRYYPKTYDKGGWNIPNVKWWLDVYKLPNVEE